MSYRLVRHSQGFAETLGVATLPYVLRSVERAQASPEAFTEGFTLTYPSEEIPDGTVLAEIIDQDGYLYSFIADSMEEANLR